MTYVEFRLELGKAAVSWEQAAEKARSLGRLELARSCSEQAIRCRYLSEDDPDVQAIFDVIAGSVAEAKP